MLARLKKYIVNRVLSKLNAHTWSHYYRQGEDTNTLETHYPEISTSHPTDLCQIMNNCGSDKGRGWHNYTRVYHAIFKDKQVKNIFELGIGTTDENLTSNMGPEGIPMASHRGWRNYFEGANIYAADIDASVVKTEERIYAYQCDQTNTGSIEALWSQPTIPKTFDIIIDDGLHEFAANTHFFEHSIHKLKAGGIYVIEDIKSIALGSWEQKITTEYTEHYPDLIFRICSIPNLTNALDNNLLIIYNSN